MKKWADEFPLAMFTNCMFTKQMDEARNEASRHWVGLLKATEFPPRELETFEVAPDAVDDQRRF